MSGRQRTIFKYVLPIGGGQIWMAEPGEVIAIQANPINPGSVWVWAIVEEGAKRLVPHKYQVYGTGHPLPSDPGRHVATCVAAAGALTWHVFEVPPVEERPPE